MKASEEIGFEPQWDLYIFKDTNGEIASASRAGARVSDLGAHRHETVIGNCTLTTGRMAMIDLFAGTGQADPWDAEHAHIGIGDGAEPAEPSQKGLMGVNKAYAPMDATYPHRTGDTCTWRGTFGPDQAMFVWNESAVANGPGDGAVCLNRKVKQRSMKFEGETWIMELSMRFKAVDTAEEG